MPGQEKAGQLADDSDDGDEPVSVDGDSAFVASLQEDDSPEPSEADDSFGFGEDDLEQEGDQALPPESEEAEVPDAKQDMDVADQSIAKTTEATKRTVLQAGDSDSSVELQSDNSFDSDFLRGEDDPVHRPPDVPKHEPSAAEEGSEASFKSDDSEFDSDGG